MLSPNASYRMSKSGKITLARAWNRPAQAQLRRSIIQSELAARIQPRAKRERDQES